MYGTSADPPPASSGDSRVTRPFPPVAGPTAPPCSSAVPATPWPVPVLAKGEIITYRRSGGVGGAVRRRTGRASGRLLAATGPASGVRYPGVPDDGALRPAQRRRRPRVPDGRPRDRLSAGGAGARTRPRRDRPAGAELPGRVERGCGPPAGRRGAVDRAGRRLPARCREQHPGRRTASAHLEAMGVRQLFDTIVTSFEAGWRKSHPAVYRAASRELGADPGAALFVGDTYRADPLGPPAPASARSSSTRPAGLPCPKRRVSPRHSRSPPAWRNPASPRPTARARPSPAAPARRVRPSAPGRSGAAARPPAPTPAVRAAPRRAREPRSARRPGPTAPPGPRPRRPRRPSSPAPGAPSPSAPAAQPTASSRTSSAVSRSSLPVSVRASAVRCLAPLATAPPRHTRAKGGSGPYGPPGSAGSGAEEGQATTDGPRERGGGGVPGRVPAEGRQGTTGATKRNWTCPSGGSRWWRRC
ncbi:HAD family hydrolase [Streptomyces albidoflavus]